MTTGTQDRIVRNVAIRFRTDAGRADALCTITYRQDEVLIEVDPDATDAPVRILGRRVGERNYQGLGVGPAGEVLAARWAVVGNEQVGILTGDGYDALFALGGVIVDLAPEVTRRPSRPVGPDA